MTQTHSYQSHLLWDGTTGVGYDDYERTHRVVLPAGRRGAGSEQ